MNYCQFKEHGTFKKDTLDALRWALDDVWKPNVEYDKDEGWITPEYSKVSSDWETGQVVYN